jgi:hypothetical protein
MPLDYMLRIMRDPNASNTRRDEMARAAVPYLHPKIVATTYVPPQDQLEDNTINVVFVSAKPQPTAPDRPALPNSDCINQRMLPVTR